MLKSQHFEKDLTYFFAIILRTPNIHALEMMTIQCDKENNRKNKSDFIS